MKIKMTSKNKNFEIVSRPYGDRWKHKTQDFWVVFYESLAKIGKPCFSAYRSTRKAVSRDPWTVDNKCVGDFNTLEEAMMYADKPN